MRKLSGHRCETEGLWYDRTVVLEAAILVPPRVAAPSCETDVLSYLAFLACPLSMGAMMWWMMRGDRDRPNRSPSHDARIEMLQREIDELRRSGDEVRDADRAAVHTTR